MTDGIAVLNVHGMAVLFVLAYRPHKEASLSTRLGRAGLVSFWRLGFRSWLLFSVDLRHYDAARGLPLEVPRTPC